MIKTLKSWRLWSSIVVATVLIIVGLIKFTTIFDGFSFGKKEPPLISVIMSTYNRANYEIKFLNRSIDSILNQTEGDFEFIIINDGSQDDTAKILKEYAKKDKRIKVLTNWKNKGLIYSLNRGLKVARGTYIARMDDDYVSIPNRFEIQRKFFEENPDITASGSAPDTCLPDVRKLPVNTKNSYKLQKFDVSDAYFASYYSVPISHPSSMVRRDFLKKHNIRYRYDYPAAEDLGYWSDVVANGGKIVRMDIPLVYHDIHPYKQSDYRMTQINSTAKYAKDAMKGVLPEESLEVFGQYRNICLVQNYLMNKIGEYPYFTKENIEHFLQLENCPKMDVVFLEGPILSDFFVINGKEGTLYNLNKDARVVERTDDKIVLKWKYGHSETYNKTADRVYSLAPAPLVSVIMPVYNREDLVGRAIDSILNQTFKDFEFIIVDDGSNEATKKLLEEYAQKDKRIRLIRNEKNRGIAYSRQRGLEAARGTYVANMDSDDWSVPERLEKTLAFMKDYPEVDAVSGDYKEISNFDYIPDYKTPFIRRYHKEYMPGYIEVDLMFQNSFRNVASLYKRAFVIKHGLKYDMSFISAEDYVFWAKIAMAGGKMARIKDVLTFVRMHGENTKEYYDKMDANAIQVRKKMISRFFKPGEEEDKLMYNKNEKCYIMLKSIEVNSHSFRYPNEYLINYFKKNCTPNYDFEE